MHAHCNLLGRTSTKMCRANGSNKRMQTKTNIRKTGRGPEKKNRKNRFPLQVDEIIGQRQPTKVILKPPLVKGRKVNLEPTQEVKEWIKRG